MKRILIISLVILAFAMPTKVFAKKTTYIVTDKRLNYVKLVEVKASVAEERNITHPVEISTEQMRNILENLNLSKEHLVGDKVDSKQIFNEQAINYLASALSRAFREAQPNEEVQFSYVVKNPYVILRNDRLTMIDTWVSGNELYLDFKKLYAKMTGDTDKRGNYSKIISRAKGVRVSLELGPGQQMAAVGSNILIVDLKQSQLAPLASSVQVDSADQTKGQALKDIDRKKSKYSRSKSSEGEVVAASAEAASSSSAAQTASSVSTSSSEDDAVRRLEKLDMLRKRNLISSKEYKEKKAEILKDL